LNAWILFTQLLAQADAAPADGADGANPPGASGLFSFLPAVLMAIMLYFFLILRPEQRKQAAHRAQIESLKKNDRVVTIGGLYGVVMSVQRESDEVTLKIDEANNTKIRVTLASISRVMGGDTAADKPAST
jgi:preprotein translocase subunit YajC